MGDVMLGAQRRQLVFMALPYKNYIYVQLKLPQKPQDKLVSQGLTKCRQSSEANLHDTIVVYDYCHSGVWKCVIELQVLLVM